MATPLRDSKPSLIRRITRPFAELWLGLKDARSPEMREIRERASVAEMRMHGKSRFVMRKASTITAAFLGLEVLGSIGSILVGKHTWGWLLGGDALRDWAIVGVVCYITLTFLIGTTSETLRRKYPDEFQDEKG